MSLHIESPPIFLYGSPTESTGSILLGLLKLNIEPVKHTPRASPSDANVELDLVTLSLVQTVKLTRLLLIQLLTVSHCHDCSIRKNELARWDVLTSLTSFGVGTHGYPFSHLLPGLLPASSKLGSPHSASYIKYDLIATAKKAGHRDVVVKLPLNISRSILRGPDRNSLRVFPPTEVTATAVLPSVVYPKLSFPIELKLHNVVSDSNDKRWRMRKLAWRIEEHTKVKAFTCPKHEGKLHTIEELHKKTKDTDGPSKSSGHHHSTIQSSTFFGPCPTLQTQQPQTPSAQPETSPTGLANSDDVEPLEDAPSGPLHEYQQFVEDFVPGASTNTAPTSPDEQPARPEGLHEGLALYVDELRTVSHGEIKSGWKSDFSGRGTIELVADISAINCSTGLSGHITKRTSEDHAADDNVEGLRHGANISCDIDDPLAGIYVNHTLIVEMVVAEELVQAVKNSLSPKTLNAGLVMSLTPVNSTNSVASGSENVHHPVGVPTGAARVLRMQFKLPITERSGLGIAWDDEVPPTYEDVRTLSPPTYLELGLSTPVATPSSQSIVAPIATRTPGVLYGIGGTPGVGQFGQPSIDSMVELDERIQELSL